MASPLVLYKNEGETPLACIERARRDGKIAEGVKATYAGRLDPMAEGVLLVLVGKDVHEKDSFLRLPKEYEVKILLGISTDTADILGTIREVRMHEPFSNEAIKEALQKCTGTFEEEYPKYSSKTLEGKSLFSLTRLGRIFSSPKHTVIIHCSILQNTTIRNCKDVAEESIMRVEKVVGDFRQREIQEKWRDVGKKYGEKGMQIITIRVSCESGAYMRVLAEKIGALLGSPALALSIKRTRVGDYHI